MVHKTVRPFKIMRAKCLDCCCNSYNEVENCTIERCPLYDYRFGYNPYRAKRQLTDEQKKAAADRLKQGRENKKRA